MIVFFFVVALFLLIVLMKSIKIVPQKQVKIIERLGKYHGTAEAGLNVILPFVDSVRHHRHARADHEDRAAARHHARQRHDGGGRGHLLSHRRSCPGDG
jgi:regulator of protease activity HflC (stomatin/prohibitin superfamily)